MAYFLRRENKKRGLYLQMYDSYWDKDEKQSRTKSVMAFGYVYYERHCKRDFGKVFFDFTNYYFEIDLPSEDKQRGPSKENRHAPIIGQALLLDASLVPLAMQIYPGNRKLLPKLHAA